jgi:predicted lipoprotein with Yx(FWY)xxD motif
VLACVSKGGGPHDTTHAPRPHLAITLALALVGAALAQAATPVVQVRYDAALGHFLTDDAGMTLYVFSNDEPGVSNCVGNCAVNWPPVIVGEASLITAPLAIPAGFATTTRADGGVQLTYGGWPLYGWVNDAAPGDTTGQGVGGNWWVANLNPVVRVATHPTLGEILVGPTGMTLYTFRNDADGTSNCNGNCAANWPPLVGGFDPAGVMPALGDGVGRRRRALRARRRRRLRAGRPGRHAALLLAQRLRPRRRHRRRRGRQLGRGAALTCVHVADAVAHHGEAVVGVLDAGQVAVAGVPVHGDPGRRDRAAASRRR